MDPRMARAFSALSQKTSPPQASRPTGSRARGYQQQVRGAAAQTKGKGKVSDRRPPTQEPSREKRPRVSAEDTPAAVSAEPSSRGGGLAQPSQVPAPRTSAAYNISGLNLVTLEDTMNITTSQLASHLSAGSQLLVHVNELFSEVASRLEQQRSEMTQAIYEARRPDKERIAALEKEVDSLKEQLRVESCHSEAIQRECDQKVFVAEGYRDAAERKFAEAEQQHRAEIQRYQLEVERHQLEVQRLQDLYQTLVDRLGEDGEKAVAAFKEGDAFVDAVTEFSTPLFGLARYRGRLEGQLRSKSLAESLVPGTNFNLVVDPPEAEWAVAASADPELKALVEEAAACQPPGPSDSGEIIRILEESSDDEAEDQAAPADRSAPEGFPRDDPPPE